MDRWIYATDEERDEKFGKGRWYVSAAGFCYRYPRHRGYFVERWPACEVAICPWCGRYGAPHRMRFTALPLYGGKRERWEHHEYVCIGCVSRAAALRRRHEAYLAIEALIADLKREAYHAAQDRNDRGPARLSRRGHGGPPGRPDGAEQGGPHCGAGGPD